jgi:hypothetical protein
MLPPAPGAEAVFAHEAQLFGHDDPSAQADAEMRHSVSVSGDTAVVGCPLDDACRRHRGRLGVRLRALGDHLDQAAEDRGSDGTTDDEFGSSRLHLGETVVVGPQRRQRHRRRLRVRALGFHLDAEQKLVAPAANERGFGHAVSVYADTLVVGTPFQASQSGAVYVFVRSGAIWSLQQKLTASDATATEI